MNKNRSFKIVSAIVITCSLIAAFFVGQRPFQTKKSTFNCYLNEHKQRSRVKIEKNRSKDSIEVGDYDENIHIDSDTYLIPRAYYFENLHDYHGENDSDICTIISTQILLGYYDTFVNDTLVDEIYDRISVETSNTQLFWDYVQSPGTGKIDDSEHGQDFKNYLIDLAIDELGSSPVNVGMDILETHRLLKRYLDDSNLSYTLDWEPEVTNNRTKNHILATLNAGRPILCNARGHSTVAFGYNETYVFVVDGYGSVAGTLWETFETNYNLNYDLGAIDLLMTCEHYHSDNYYSAYYNRSYCPDGYAHKRASYQPNEYGFEAQYYFYQKTKNVYNDTDTILTKRLRTGYIENLFVNLSPRREDAGIAFLEFTTPSIIRNITVNISFWSANELYNPIYHHAKIQYKDIDGLWIDAFDLLNDISLSTDRNHQNIVGVTFPEETTSFRFYATNFAIGDSNKGRISLGELNIIYENI